MNNCNKCGKPQLNCCDVCDCLNIDSSDQSVSVTKNGCDVDIKIDFNTIDKLIKINNGKCISFIKEIIGNQVVYTPVLDFQCIANQVCGMCQDPPEFRVTNAIDNPEDFSQIEAVTNTGSWYNVNSGTFPVGMNDAPIIGTHEVYNGIISVDVSAYLANELALELRVNGSLIETLAIAGGVNATYGFTSRSYGANDDIEIILIEDTPPIPIPNLIFTWQRTAGDFMDLTFVSSPQYGINNTFGQVDWGDGTINNSKTHLYTTNGNYTVRVFDSNATLIDIHGSNVTSVIQIPDTAQSILFNNNSITNYPAFTSNNLVSVDFQGNLITNNPDFTGTPNLINIAFTSNNITGTLDVSMLPDLETIFFNNNSIGAVSSLSNNPSLKRLHISSNAGMTFPVVTSNPQLESLLFGDNSSDVLSLDVTNNPLLQILDFSLSSILSPLDLSNNPDLILLNLANTTLNTLDLTNQTNLETLDVSSNGMTNIINIENTKVDSFKGNVNSFDVTNVNRFLVHVNSQAKSGPGRLFTTAGQMPSATPTGAGLTAKAALITRNYDPVSTD